MHGDGAREVVDAMDPVACERERVTGGEPGHAALALDAEILADHLAFDHVDPAAGAVVVVVAAVARLPPGVEPGLGAGSAPEQDGLARAFAVESVDVDQGGDARGQLCAAVGLEKADGADGDRIDLQLHGRMVARWAASVREDALVSVVSRIEAWPVNVPLEATYLMAPGVYPGMSRTVVRVTTADGVVGLGETPSAADAALLVGDLGETFVGSDTGMLREALGRHVGPAGGERVGAAVITPNAAAGVEMALWDIAGREAGLPLHALLGETVRTEITFTEYFAPRPGREETPAEIAAYCARMVEEHRSPSFEGKVGVWAPEVELELVRLVREAIGPDRPLRLDANMGWSLETARTMLAALAAYDIASIEEPVATFAELASLRTTTPIPFSSHTPDLESAAALGVPDALVLGIGACGGIAGTLRFVERCAAAGVGFWFYSGDLGIGTAAQLHVTAVAPSLSAPSQSLLRWTADDVTAEGPFSPERGLLRVPDGPGLGVTLDERALARCADRFARKGAYDLYTGPPLPRC